jgi:hypothetical protein
MGENTTHIYVVYILPICLHNYHSFYSYWVPMGSRDSSVGIALGYGLDDLGSRVRFLAVAGNFSLHHRVQDGSGAHEAPYQMGTGGSFLGGKTAGA